MLRTDRQTLKQTNRRTRTFYPRFVVLIVLYVYRRATNVIWEIVSVKYGCWTVLQTSERLQTHLSEKTSQQATCLQD